jgi:hypothetical protein
MKIFEFELPDTGRRPFILAIPADKIFSVKTQSGSEAVYCMVNDIRVDYDYRTLIKELEEL